MLHALTQMPPRSIDVPAIAAGAVADEDAAALRLVVRAVAASVLGVGKDHPDVEDCAHEALSRALEGKERLREGEALRPWVIGIARHVALDVRRARRRSMREVTASPGESEEGDRKEAAFIERIEDPAPGPEERAATAERARRLDEAMRSLSEDQRRAVLMFHVEGLGYQEIARSMGVPLGTVATWISRGRQAVKGALGEAGERSDTAERKV